MIIKSIISWQLLLAIDLRHNFGEKLWHKIYILQHLSCKFIKVDEICMMDDSLSHTKVHGHQPFILLKNRKKKAHLHKRVERTVCIRHRYQNTKEIIVFIKHLAMFETKVLKNIAMGGVLCTTSPVFSWPPIWMCLVNQKRLVNQKHKYPYP